MSECTASKMWLKGVLQIYAYFSLAIQNTFPLRSNNDDFSGDWFINP